MPFISRWSDEMSTPRLSTTEQKTILGWLYEGDSSEVNELVQTGGRYFDFNLVDEVWGTPLLAILAGNMWNPSETSDQTFVAKKHLAAFCLMAGANPEQHAPDSCRWRACIGWASAPLAGNSPISLTGSLFSQLDDDCDPGWYSPWTTPRIRSDLQMAKVRLREVLELLTKSHAPGPQEPIVNNEKVRILDCVQSLWESVHKQQSLADAKLLVKESPDRSPIVLTAHSWLLKQACPGMALNEDKEVEIRSTRDVVQNFLSLIYSGCYLEGRPTLDVLLEICSLADQMKAWTILRPLIGQIREELALTTFAQICTVALTSENAYLLIDCQKFLERTAPLEDAWVADLPRQVRDFIQETLGWRTLQMQNRML